MYVTKDGQILITRRGEVIYDLHVKQDGTIVHSGEVLYAPRPTGDDPKDKVLPIGSVPRKP